MKKIFLLLLCVLATWGTYVLTINHIEQLVLTQIKQSSTELDQEKERLTKVIGELEYYQARYQTALDDVTVKAKLLEKLDILSQGIPLLIQVETGVESITKQQLPELAKPEGCAGKRGLDKHWVEFKTKFMEPPKVLSTLASVDFAKGVDHRINTKVSNVTKEGFSLDLLTWCDTSISKVEASWIAVGY